MVVLPSDLTYLSWAADEITRIVSDQNHLDELEPQRFLRVQEQFEKYPNLVGGISIRDQISTKKFKEVRTSLYREFAVDRYPVQIGKPTIMAKYFVLSFARERNPPQEILVMPLFDRTIAIRPTRRFQGKKMRAEGVRIPKIIYRKKCEYEDPLTKKKIYKKGYRYLDFLAQIMVFLLQGGFIKKREMPITEKIFGLYVEETFPDVHSKIDFNEDIDDILKNSLKFTVGGYYNPLGGPLGGFTFKNYVKETINGQIKGSGVRLHSDSDAQNMYGSGSWTRHYGDPKEDESEVKAFFNEEISILSQGIQHRTHSRLDPENNEFQSKVSLNDGISILSAAKQLSIPKSTVYRWRREGKIRASRTYSYRDKDSFFLLSPDQIESIKGKIQGKKQRKDQIDKIKRQRKINRESARKYLYRKSRIS